jgi:CO/xanthine dehydrogenase FAD-binding subunit
MNGVYLPESPAQLWEVLSLHPQGVLYAGGTDLLVRIGKGLLRPTVLVCLERIPELRGVEDHGDRIFLGGCSTHSSLLKENLIRDRFPILAEGIRSIGSPHIRNMGTLGGNIVTASPAGDTLPPLYVLDAEIQLLGRASSRIVPIRDFILGPGRTDLREGEILGGVWLKKERPWQVSFFEKVGRRKALSISVVSLAALLRVSDDGSIQEARLAWGSVGPTIVSSPEVERFLVGRSLGEATWREAGILAAKAVSPIDDVRATASYRRRVSGNLLLRLSDPKWKGAPGEPLKGFETDREGRCG